MDFKQMLLAWLISGLAITLILGGEPWIFPQHGKLWLSQFHPASLDSMNKETAQPPSFSSPARQH